MSLVVFKSYVSRVQYDKFRLLCHKFDHLSFSTCSMKDNQLTDSDG